MQKRVAFPNATELSQAIDELFEEYPVALYHSLDTVAPFPDYQSHDGYEFYYVWKGQGAYIAGSRVFPLGPGTLMPLSPRLMHKVLQTDMNEPICRHVLLVKDDYYRREGLARIFPTVEDSSPPLGAPIVIPEAGREAIERLLQGIQEELAHKETGFEHAISGYVRVLLSHFRRYGIQTESKTDFSGAGVRLPSEVVYMIQHIGSNFQFPLALGELAKKIHMNPSYASQLFHRHTGHTLRQFITLKRMDHARQLLLDTVLPIHAIAIESGYNDCSHFIRMFKSTFGQTPEAFRQRDS